MKKSLFLILFLGIVALSSTAQENKASVGDSIIFKALVYDYGTILKGSPGEGEFVFVNKGKAPLLLSSVRSSCGCTVPTWPREPIQPGKSGTIKVKYDTNRVGPINKSITVVSNATNSNVVLKIAGTVKNQ